MRKKQLPAMSYSEGQAKAVSSADFGRPNYYKMKPIVSHTGQGLISSQWGRRFGSENRGLRFVACAGARSGTQGKLRINALVL
jgi:hypothetical protein